MTLVELLDKLQRLEEEGLGNALVGVLDVASVLAMNITGVEADVDPDGSTVWLKVEEM